MRGGLAALLVVTAVVAALVVIVGERHPTTAFLLYVPPQVWLLPVAAALLPALVVSRRLVLVMAVLTGVHGVAFMGWRMPARDPGPGDDRFTIVTNNHGQSGGSSVASFVESMDADLVVIQEADWRLSPRDVGMADTGESGTPPPRAGTARTAEFLVTGRHPIAGRRLIVLDFLDRRQIVAARFEIDLHGRRVIVYNVHLPTPRKTLSELSRGGFLLGLLDFPGSPWAGRAASQRRYWRERIRLTRELVDLMAAESDPVIAAGDFNLPAHGYLHRVVSRTFRDAHAEAGGGFGFTFPGDADRLLTFAEPWMRIDHIRVDAHWEVLACTTEAQRPSQHRAVAARLRLLPSP